MTDDRLDVHLNIIPRSMSLKANLSIILQLHSFRNLALPHKARYALQVHFYQGKPGKNVAMPFNVLQTELKPRRNVSREGCIDDHYFRSKCFNIEYQDQEIELNDCCQFKMVVEGFPSLDDSHLYLEFILLENNQCYFRENMEEPVNFREAERYRFRLENIEGGIVRYHEGEFCKSYVSSFAFSLYLMVTDYRFQPFLNHSKSESSKDRAREKVSNLTQLMEWAGKYLKNWQDPQQFYSRFVKNLRYNSVLLRGEFFGTLKVERQQVKLEIPQGEKRELVVVSDKEFFEYVTNYQPEHATEQLIKMDIYQINQQNFYFFQTAAKHIARGDVDLKSLKQKYRTERRDLFAQRLLRTLVFGKQPSGKQQTSKLASKLRKRKRISDLKIIDQHLFSQRENQHYAMLEVNLPHSLKTHQYEISPSQQVLRELSELRRAQMKERLPYDERNMVVFFCHGFQASSFDMEMLKREVSKMLPTAVLHASTCNEMDTDGDIALMGLRLADEVAKVVQRNFEDSSQAIINFVGHSMGGIIARACLAHIPQFRTQLGFFLSLSTPHLGYLSGVDAKIKAGLWFMRKMNKVTSLDQLALEDAESPRETLLFKLSQSGHLRDFQKIILLSSSQDSYVPWHSARACYPEQTNNIGRLQREMVDSIVGDKIVHRVDVHFDIDSTKDIDSFIGRAAHIHLLTQECIFKLINEAVPSLFDIREL